MKILQTFTQEHLLKDIALHFDPKKAKYKNILIVSVALFSVLALLCLAPGNNFFTSAMVMTIIISLVMILLNLTFEQLIVNAQRLKVLSH